LQVSANLVQGEVAAVVAGGGAEGEAFDDDEASGGACGARDERRVLGHEGEERVVEAAAEDAEAAVDLVGAAAGEAGDLRGAEAVMEDVLDEHAVVSGQVLGELDEAVGAAAPVGEAVASGGGGIEETGGVGRTHGGPLPPPEMPGGRGPRDDRRAARMRCRALPRPSLAGMYARGSRPPYLEQFQPVG
jgi:hypothetical protein